MGIFWSLLDDLWRPKTRLKKSEKWPKSLYRTSLLCDEDETDGKLNEKTSIEDF